MADVTNALGFRKLEATLVAACYFFSTLHGSGGSALDASTDSWTGAGMADELPTGYGYTQGGVALGQGSVSSNTNVDTGNAVWTASGGPIGPAYYEALWVNTSNTMTGAKLICVKDKSGATQTASDGNTMTGTITDPIQY